MHTVLEEQLRQCEWTAEHEEQAPPLRYSPTAQVRQLAREVHEGQGQGSQELLVVSRKRPTGQLRQSEAP